ncbi:hypothetical protein [Dictyobacter arantiisoli]|uniref:Uncharacterized protein n=1 Tax=Dictyobacter arantiisoli TaxID=2014874 RepID=A0A5A5T6D1_9CHLR|nr:hypothetical protein [Dictyobacter arantiisoli]GCF06589.1 hypothetical protein KDI_01530 [Dictyobacter arantiisoli]
MEDTNNLPSYKIKKIAILENVDDGPEMWLPPWVLSGTGCKGVRVPDELRTLPEVMDFVKAHAQALICVHRLGTYEEPLFYGAELVAKLYDDGFPAVLITRFLDIDQHSTIRRWRDKVPVAFDVSVFRDSYPLKEALDLCVRELQGQFSEERIPKRVVMQVEGIEDKKYMDVTVEEFSQYIGVRLPLVLLPEALRKKVKAGSWLSAMVNIKAGDTYDLYFRDFELSFNPELGDCLLHFDNVLDEDGNENPFPLWRAKPESDIDATQLERVNIDSYIKDSNNLKN